jgi:hypothetical protein
VLSRFVGQKLTAFVCSENHEDMLVLKELIEAGKVVRRTASSRGGPVCRPA